MVYSISLTTKLEKAAQKHKWKEILNLSWKSAGMIMTFKFLNLVSVVYETNIFTGNKKLHKNKFMVSLVFHISLRYPTKLPELQHLLFHIIGGD